LSVAPLLWPVLLLALLLSQWSLSFCLFLIRPEMMDDVFRLRAASSAADLRNP